MHRIVTGRRRWAQVVLAVVACVPATLAEAPPATAEPVVSFGPSDADSVQLLAGSYYINKNQANGVPYWWDHTQLTVAVQAAPSSDAEDIQAVHDAIALWNSVLSSRLPGITMTDVTTRNPKSADIVVHLVPQAGGIVWGGLALCSPNRRCLNVMVRTDEPPGQLTKGKPDIADFDPLRVERTALHELGHALGLGHASPLEASTDIMGYGWSIADPDVTPILSDCDIEGIRTAFGWFYANEPPHISTVPEIIC